MNHELDQKLYYKSNENTVQYEKLYICNVYN